jgi:hypothetical protein
MLVQALRDITLPGGDAVRRGEVIHVSEAIAADLLRLGHVRERVRQPALETTAASIPRPPKTSPVLESPTPGPGGEILSWQNEDNVVRNLVTVGYPGYVAGAAIDGDTDSGVPLTLTLADRDPVLTLEEIKAYLRIDADYTAEDIDIQRMERSAHAACENALRRVGEIEADCGENIKQALLWDIAFQWEHRDPASFPDDYNREASFLRWLPGERDYPGVY